jgi:hypothetical protein
MCRSYCRALRPCNAQFAGMQLRGTRARTRTCSVASSPPRCPRSCRTRSSNTSTCLRRQVIHTRDHLRSRPPLKMRLFGAMYPVQPHSHVQAWVTDERQLRATASMSKPCWLSSPSSSPCSALGHRSRTAPRIRPLPAAYDCRAMCTAACPRSGSLRQKQRRRGGGLALGWSRGPVRDGGGQKDGRRG